MNKNRKYIIAAFALVIIAIFYLPNIYLPISGTVVDAENGQPVEGAVVLVEWTKTHGLGEHWTESYKVAEVLTDKNGKFSLPGEYNPSVDPPTLTIYKKEYVAWNSREIFPDYKKRTNFRWASSSFKLDHFKTEYSYIDHTAFISNVIRSGLGNKKLLENSYYWEAIEASKERNKKRSK